MTATITLLFLGTLAFAAGIYFYVGSHQTGDYNGLILGWVLVQTGRHAAGLGLVMWFVHAVDTHSAPTANQLVGILFAITLWAAGRMVGKPQPVAVQLTA